MKNFLLILLITGFFSFSATAQNVNEYGLMFSNLNGFGLTYKKGKENTLTRFSAASLNLNLTDFDNVNLYLRNIGAGIYIGHENRIIIQERLKFVHGPEFGLFLSYSRGPINGFEMQPVTVISPCFGYIIGLNYALSERFLLSAELIPSISYRHVRSPLGNSNNIDLGFASGSALMTLAYRVFK